MKSFNAPMMTVITLARESIVCGSWCNHYYCSDCVECGGKYDCFSFHCVTKYNDGNGSKNNPSFDLPIDI